MDNNNTSASKRSDGSNVTLKPHQHLPLPENRPSTCLLRDVGGESDDVPSSFSSKAEVHSPCSTNKPVPLHEVLTSGNNINIVILPERCKLKWISRSRLSDEKGFATTAM